MIDVRDQELRHNLSWACQALLLLNQRGFPSAKDALFALDTGDAEKIRKAANEVVSNTRHIAHPALTALRKNVVN